MALLGLGLGLTAALLVGMNQQVPKEMTLDNLTIMKGLVLMKDGTPRVAIGTNEKDGGVGMAILDLQGNPRIAMGTDTKGDGGMVVMDKDEAPRIMMGSGPDGAGIMLIGAGLTEMPAPAKPAK